MSEIETSGFSEPEYNGKLKLMPKDLIKSELNKAIEEYLTDFESKSFSGRHPELGKMVNCPVCSLRHRSVHVCTQRHVVELTPPDGLTGLTKFQVLGRAAFKKKRVKPHYSKKRLQLLQRTIERFPLHNGMWASTEEKSAELVAMQVARREARADLADVRRAVRKEKQSAQHRSRRINRGLLQGNSRIHR
jgi:hypothetical protein